LEINQKKLKRIEKAAFESNVVFEVTQYLPPVVGRE
jgi:hypothetical protein